MRKEGGKMNYMGDEYMEGIGWEGILGRSGNQVAESLP
jgi:hypothetical protein